MSCSVDKSAFFAALIPGFRFMVLNLLAMNSSATPVSTSVNLLFYLCQTSDTSAHSMCHEFHNEGVATSHRGATILFEVFHTNSSQAFVPSVENDASLSKQ